MRVNPGIIPPNGWHYPVDNGQTLRTDSLDALVDALFAYRLRNNQPPSNVKADIDRYFCAKWPSFCQLDPTDYGKPNEPGAGERLDRRVARTITQLLHASPRGGYPFVNSDVALERAKCCETCPRNKTWKVTCGSCNANMLSAIAQLKNLRTTQKDGSLRACEVTGRELTSDVHLPDVVTAPTQEEARLLPPQCWKLKLLSNP